MILGWQETEVLGKTLDECGVKWLTPEIGLRVAAYIHEPTGDSLESIMLIGTEPSGFSVLEQFRSKQRVPQGFSSLAPISPNE